MDDHRINTPSAVWYTVAKQHQTAIIAPLPNQNDLVGNHLSPQQPFLALNRPGPFVNQLSALCDLEAPANVSAWSLECEHLMSPAISDLPLLTAAIDWNAYLPTKNAAPTDTGPAEISGKPGIVLATATTALASRAKPSFKIHSPLVLHCRFHSGEGICTQYNVCCYNVPLQGLVRQLVPEGFALMIKAPRAVEDVILTHNHSSNPAEPRFLDYLNHCVAAHGGRCNATELIVDTEANLAMLLSKRQRKAQATAAQWARARTYATS